MYKFLNNSLLPLNISFNVETSNDLPKRRGRERKKYLPLFYNFAKTSVLSMYK